MLRSILNFLFPSVPAVFPSDYPLAESVERLRRAVPVSFPGRFGRSTVTGTIYDDFVELVRLLPFDNNSDSLLFFGSFLETDQGVVLTGRFTMRWWVKAYASLWLGLPVFSTVWITASLAASGGTANWGLPLFGLVVGLGFIPFVVGYLKLIAWLRRKDIPMISQVITTALTSPEKNQKP